MTLLSTVYWTTVNIPTPNISSPWWTPLTSSTITPLTVLFRGVLWLHCLWRGYEGEAEARAGRFGLDRSPSQPTMTKQIGKHTQCVWWRNLLYTTQDGYWTSSHSSAFVCLEANLRFVNKYTFWMISESTLPRSQQPANIHWTQDLLLCYYRGADMSLARPRRKQATATEDFEFHMSYL